MVQFNKLKLTGFKSFVESTELDIGKGLTGIVGPNGCGKSNLVEALRWVMGENSPKRMRSSEMNDVIFNGTEARPARNTAEVMVMLDNSDRTAPAEINDADELEISRKIERDVGSVYRVNGKNVRMRDVQLLFADSSIGAHSPALVSQGRVADMINAKPAQRRMVLEEAAGISGLHARRHEAELKLRGAETNLTRVEDVIGAMSLQLDGLKKQARQASRYRNLNGHIQAAEGSLLYLRWLRTSAAVTAARTAFAQAEDHVRDMTLEVTRRTTVQAEAAALLPALRQKEAEAAAALQHLKLAYGALESEERQIEEERQKSERLLSEFENDLAHEGRQQTEAESATARLSEEDNGLSVLSERQAQDESRAADDVDESAAAVTAMENAVFLLTEEVSAAESRRAAALRRQDDLRQRRDALERKRQALIEEQSARNAEMSAAGDIAAEAEALDSAEALARQRLSEIDSSEAAFTAADRAAEDAAEQLKAAEKALAERQAEAEALRRVLRSSLADHPSVLDDLSVDPGYEKALAVALGEGLEASLDRAAPLHWQTDGLDDGAFLPSLPAGAETLSAFVRGPAALRRALSQIGVVADMAMAEALREHLQPGQTLVARDGAAWRWDGLVATPEAKNAGALRLQNKNRLAEVEGEMDERQAVCTARRAMHEDARAAKAAAQDAAAAARQAYRDAEQTCNALRQKLEVSTAQHAGALARLEVLAATLQSLSADLAALGAEEETAETHARTLPDPAPAKAALEAKKAELDRARETLSEQKIGLSRLRHDGEIRATRRRQIADEHQAWQDRLTRIAGRLADLDSRRAQVETALLGLRERPAIIAREKQTLMSAIADAEQARNAAGDALVMAENESARRQAELREAESGLADRREARAMAQAGVHTAEHAAAGIEAQIQEKFNIAPPDLATRLDTSAEELAEQDAEVLQLKLERLLRERDTMGPVNLRAEMEAQEISDKMAALEAERDDLVQAIGKLRDGINKLNREARERLVTAFDAVNAHFQSLFTRLFSGGGAYLKLIEADDPLEAGLEIYAQPPGKKLQVLSLLSGGEQTLTSIALIFAMFLTNPAPICVLDEVDAPLDESNVDRYCTLLEELAKEGKTRFIIITHHRLTMARMDRLYGVTMSEKGVSQLVSVDLTQHELQLDQAA